MENKIRFSEVLKKYTMVIVLALVIILFTVNTGGKMLLPQNVNNLIVQNAYVFILATGMSVSYTHLDVYKRQGRDSCDHHYERRA